MKKAVILLVSYVCFSHTAFSQQSISVTKTFATVAEEVEYIDYQLDSIAGVSIKKLSRVNALLEEMEPKIQKFCIQNTKDTKVLSAYLDTMKKYATKLLDYRSQQEGMEKGIKRLLDITNNHSIPRDLIDRQQQTINTILKAIDVSNEAIKRWTKLVALLLNIDEKDVQLSETMLSLLQSKGGIFLAKMRTFSIMEAL